MAKGFTVKSAAAKAKKQAETPEWDYDKAKRMIAGKTVVFCLPGRGVSYTFLKNFVKTLISLFGSCLILPLSSHSFPSSFSLRRTQSTFPIP